MVNEAKANAMPTKNLFLNILTKDISVEDSIMDMLDNSIDGFIRTGRRLNDAHHKIEIKMTADYFEISDNCGGMALEDFKDRIFEFGSRQFKSGSPTLGLYGIGLKRALFKIGKQFDIETDDGINYMKMSVDVNEWSKNEDWDFPFEYDDSKLRNGELGFTKITINSLNETLSEKFSVNTKYLNDIEVKIGKIYTLFIQKGIEIVLNGRKVEAFPITTEIVSFYEPIRYKRVIGDVEVDIICYELAKLMEKIKEEDSGWNIFCNDRLILINDKSKATGWGLPSALPKYHPIFNEFRGIVRISSNNPSKLPISTSKNGIDIDSLLYQEILKDMIYVGRPIISHLQKKYQKQSTKVTEIEEEIESVADDGKTSKQVNKFSIDDIASYDNKKQAKNVFNPPVPINEEKYVHITYKREHEKIEKLKRILKVDNAFQVGEITFDFYYNWVMDNEQEL